MSTEANKSTAESSAVVAALGGVLAVVIVTAAVIVVALVIVILILLRKLHKAEEGILLYIMIKIFNVCPDLRNTKGLELSDKKL